MPLDPQGGPYLSVAFSASSLGAGKLFWARVKKENIYYTIQEVRGSIKTTKGQKG